MFCTNSAGFFTNIKKKRIKNNRPKRNNVRISKSVRTTSKVSHTQIKNKMLRKYNEKCIQKSDINEHLPTLRILAKNCNSIIELGVRGCVSSWALGLGLIENKGSRYDMVDLVSCPVKEFVDEIKLHNIETSLYWNNSINVNLKHNYDLVFIDTWHVYGQLKRELKKYSPKCLKYIVLHDTTVDDYKGESIRMGHNIKKQSIESGIPESEIRKGLWPAVEEFVQEEKDWEIAYRWTNCNGLTVLCRKGVEIPKFFNVK